MSDAADGCAAQPVLALGARELAELFPAYLRLAPDGRIAAAGPSILAHARDGLIGADFFARFEVERPERALSMAALRDGAPPMIVTLADPGRPRLRGISLERPDGLWLLLGHIPDLEAAGQSLSLGFRDFSPTDGTLDMLLAAELRAGLLAEARSLAEALEEQKRAAERANLAKSAFLATMSHEIRTPMNGVLGLAQMLADSELTQEQRELLDVMVASGTSLMAILDDVLDLSKIESGNLEVETTGFDLRELAKGVRELFAPVAGSKGLELEMRVDAGRPFCLGDPVRIRQILVNLVSNAIKFTDDGRVSIAIALRPRPEGALLEMAVADTGIGISAEASERLFQPFVQADGSTTRRFGGTGLGLAITRRLCEQMGGGIRVESRLGRGSRFFVEIPVGIGVASAQGPADADAGAPPLGTAHVLIAEDNATNQLVLSLFLRKMGLTFDLVTHGAEALAAWDRGRYDLVLLDIEMPVLDGYEAAREIRRRELASARGRTPIIALSADAMPENRERARQVGIDEFATKPIEIGKLQGLIAKAIRDSEANSAPVHARA